MNFKVILMIAVTSSMVACSKPESTSPASTKASDQMAQDIAKIREIKELEQKEKAIQKARSDQFGKDMKQGTEAPRIEFK
jgi:hypothetical protein